MSPFDDFLLFSMYQSLRDAVSVYINYSFLHSFLLALYDLCWTVFCGHS